MPCLRVAHPVAFKQVKRQLHKVYPLLVALAVCAFIFWWQQRETGARDASLLQRLEWISHDWRVRLALSHPVPTAASNLAVVVINDQTSRLLAQMFPGDSLRWPYSHLYHGIVARELTQQEAKLVGFDIFFAQPDSEPRHRVKQGGTNSLMSGQDFFALQMKSGTNVILLAGIDRGPLSEHIKPPVHQLATNALAVGVGATGVSRDGVLRTVKPFAVDSNGVRHWLLGFELAARHLGLDLTRAEVSPDRLIVRGSNGLVREIPLSTEGAIPLDWSVHFGPPLPDEQRVLSVKYEEIIASARRRGVGERPHQLELANKLVVIGAGGTGMELYARGNTSVRNGEMMCLAELAMANALLTGRFVRTTPRSMETALALGMVTVTALAGWRLRALTATATVVLVAAVYVGVAVWCYTHHRLLLPVALPVVGALVATHLVMVACRTLENAERRQLEGLLKKVVAPKIIEALLEQDSPIPQTKRLEITVLFADLRAFTHFSEESQNQAMNDARALGLSPDAVRAFADEAARTAMNSVNRYLAAVVDEVKATDGTLDKYMGDCVMAFWGAPVADPNHAANALKCAAAAQSAVDGINQGHAAENAKRQRDNERRAAEGKPPLPLLPVLRLGIGINTGLATVGFMGSERHLSSFTAFGHEVNVASRVEGLAKGGQVILTEATLLSAARNDPTIAPRCHKQPEVMLKGISTAVRIYELQWKEPSPPATTRRA